MTRSVWIVTVLGALLAIPATATPAASAETSLRESCPMYHIRLRAALHLLEDGDRAAAVTALRAAREAIESCLREQGGETALVSVPAGTRNATEPFAASVVPCG